MCRPRSGLLRPSSLKDPFLLIGQFPEACRRVSVHLHVACTQSSTLIWWQKSPPGDEKHFNWQTAVALTTHYISTCYATDVLAWCLNILSAEITPAETTQVDDQTLHCPCPWLVLPQTPECFQHHAEEYYNIMCFIFFFIGSVMSCLFCCYHGESNSLKNVFAQHMTVFSTPCTTVLHVFIHALHLRHWHTAVVRTTADNLTCLYKKQRRAVHCFKLNPSFKPEDITAPNGGEHISNRPSGAVVKYH